MIDGRTRETLGRIFHFINVFIQSIIGILIIAGILWVVFRFFK